MSDTSASLLERLRRPGAEEAWERFVRLYTPLLFHWARRAGLHPPDDADLVQDVLALLVEKLPAFRYEPDKSFRAWLRTVTLNEWRRRCRRPPPPVTGKDAALAELPAADSVAAFWEADYRRHLVAQALKLMRAEFSPAAWQACWEHVVSGRPAAEVARELNLTAGAVRAAKFRVLRRLRRELEGLLE